MTLARATSALALLLATTAGTARAAGLDGSLRSMTRQHGVAVKARYSFVSTADQLRAQLATGKLERVTGNDDYAVSAQVRHPYAQPAVVQFVERLAADYRAATGSQLVVTSLVRPRAEQPANAHRLSVHPAGMAVDLRVPADAGARAWLEQALLGLERSGVIDATRERRPPHYHVAVFPVAYGAYVARQDGGETPAAEAPVVARASLEAPEAARPATATPAPAAQPVATIAPAGAPVALATVAPAAPASGDERLGVIALLGGIAVSVAGAALAGRRQARPATA